jgi:hypothetical protein
VDATVAAYDADGKVINNIYATLPLNLSDAQFARLSRTGLPMKQTLDLPVGAAYMRTAVLDPANGHTGATEFPLVVHAPGSSVAQTAAPASSRP